MKTPVTTNNSPPEVGATLQRLRLARGLTLEDLSRIAGVSKSMLSQIEREKANPTIAITWRLANALGVQIGELLASETRDVETIRVLDAHETPTLPGASCRLRAAHPRADGAGRQVRVVRADPGAGRRTGVAGARSGHQAST